MKKTFKVGDRVLANCGNRKSPDWVAGTVVEVEDFNSRLIQRPYRIKLEKAYGVGDMYFFVVSAVKALKTEKVKP